MENIIGAIVLGIVAIVCYVFSYLQFNEKALTLQRDMTRNLVFQIRSHFMASHRQNFST